MTTSKIEWTDRSDWNPVRGCTRVSPGCGGPGDQGGCYAEGMAARFSKPGQWGHGFAEMKSGRPRWTGKVALAEDRVTLPLRWRKPAKVFVSSTSDVFHEALPDEAIDRIFAVMALAPHLTFQLLTKRPERMRQYIADAFDRVVMAMMAHTDAGYPCVRETCEAQGLPWVQPRSADDWWPLRNVWLGTSVEDRQRANERIPDLLATPAAVRFLSCEPLLGAIDLSDIDLAAAEAKQIEACGLTTLDALTGIHSDDVNGGVPGILGEPDPKIDWVIVGGESGPRARPMHPGWVRSLRDQCLAAKTPFFFKQWGAWRPGMPVASGERGKFAVHWPHSHSFVYFDESPRQFSRFGHDASMTFVGKEDAGRTLDGAVWSEFPAEASE